MIRAVAVKRRCLVAICRWLAGVGAAALITTQAAVGCNHVGTEGITNFVECGLARFNELPREDIRVNDCNAPLCEKSGSRGFAHTHTACKT